MLERWIQAKEKKGQLIAAKAGVDLIGIYGDEPLPSSKFEIPIRLQNEWDIQARRLARTFAKDLGMSELSYLDSLPKFEIQPDQFRGRFDIPVIIDNRVSLFQLVQKAGIRPQIDVNGIGESSLRDYNEFNAYVVWLDDGRRSIGLSVDQVRKNLASDERGATLREVIFEFLSNPNILKHHGLDCPGTNSSVIFSPSLNIMYGKLRLMSEYRDSSNSISGSVIAGVIK